MKNRHYHGSMPYIIDKIIAESLEFNTLNSRGFGRNERCVAYALSGSRLCAIGYNKKKTHTFTIKYHEQLKNSIHAEADMIMELIKKELLKDVTDVVTIRGTSKILRSHPCKLCYNILTTYLPSVRLWWYNGIEWEMKII